MFFSINFNIFKNYPLYIKTATGPNTSALSEQNLKYWYTIHTSLDVVDEKTRKSDFKDLYLGLLYLIEDYRMYEFIFCFSLFLFIYFFRIDMVILQIPKLNFLL